MADMKKQSFLQGAFVLICAGLVVKIIGAGFKLPLTYLIHEEGMGLFSSAYQVYTIMFIIATAGFPVAISKMVSESIALGNLREADRVFKVALLMLLVFGTAGSFVLYFYAETIAALLKMTRAADGMRAIAPAVFCVSVMAALRGYFQGHQNMYPTAISEVAEALGKLFAGYFLAYELMKISVEKAAAGAIAGVTFGTAFGVLILLILYLHNRYAVKGIVCENEKIRSKKSIAKELIKIAIPITVGASVASLTSLIDMATVTNRLQSVTHVPQDFLIKYSSLINPQTFSGAIDEELASKLYGLYAGYAIPLFNLPLTIVSAIAMSIVPAISSALAKRNLQSSKLVTKSAIRITILLALPCAVGIYVLSQPILLLLFKNGLAVTLLEKLGVAIVFVSLLSVTSAVLQAYGHPVIPMVNMLVGGIVKIFVNYKLVALPEINIDGAPVGTVICYFLIVVLNLIFVIRITECKFRLSDFVFKPLAACAIMGVAVKFAFDFCRKSGLGDRMAVIPSIVCGAVVYLLLILLISAIKREDIRMLPKGEIIERMLTKAKLLK